MRLYLAHPIDLRKQIRKIELDIEEETGIELINPFYDLVRPEIKEIDMGKLKTCDESLDYVQIVNQDLLHIYESDGIVAFIGEHPSIGASMEIWFALSIGRPIYVVSEKHLMHPWIRYVLEVSKGKGFSTWNSFKEFIKGELCQY